MPSLSYVGEVCSVNREGRTAREEQVVGTPNSTDKGV